MGGLTRNPQAKALVERVGAALVRDSIAAKSPYKFSFHVLGDPKTINAFALPGGPIFITEGLLRQLKSEAELAGVLGHEIGHVIARHSAEHIARSELAQGLVGAAGIAGSEGADGGANTARMAAFVAQMAQLKYGRGDEIESDTLGVRLMSDAGYDPRAMIEVMRVLEEAAGGASRQPEWMSSHPDPGNRRERIQGAIEQRFPNGVPPEFTTGTAIQ
jgi:beta-barrel assembly-enhancing protease